MAQFKIGVTRSNYKEASFTMCVLERMNPNPMPFCMHYGTDTGGMHMRVSGLSQLGNPLTLNFELMAANNDGPKIPALAAVILCKKWIRAKELKVGASPCVGHISLLEFIEEAQDLSITFVGPTHEN